MESRKIVLMNLFTERNEDADIETGLVDTGEEKSRTNSESITDV